MSSIRRQDSHYCHINKPIAVNQLRVANIRSPKEQQRAELNNAKFQAQAEKLKRLMEQHRERTGNQ